MSATPTLTSLLITAAEVKGWRAQCAEIDGKIEKLKADKAKLLKKIEAVELLAPSLTLDVAEKEDPSPDGLIRERKGRPTWSALIEEQVRSSQSGIVQRDLMAKIRAGLFGDRLTESESAFYNSISKMLRKKIIVKRGDHLFTQAQYAEYMKKLEAGEVNDVAEVTNYGSPAAAVVVRFVQENPGCGSSDAIRAVWEASPTGDRQSKTSLYNMIARLVEQRHIRKEGGHLFPFSVNEASADASDAKAEEGDDLPGFLNPNPAPAGA